MSRDFAYWHREAVARGKPDPAQWAQKKVDQQRKDRERGAMRSPYPIRPARTPVRPATPWDAGHTAEPMGSRLTQPEPPAFGVHPMLDAWWEIQKERTRDALLTQGLPLSPLPELTAKEHRNAWRYERTLERKRQAELLRKKGRRAWVSALAVSSFLAALVGFFMLALHLFF